MTIAKAGPSSVKTEPDLSQGFPFGPELARISLGESATRHKPNHSPLRENRPWIWYPSRMYSTTCHLPSCS